VYATRVPEGIQVVLTPIEMASLHRLVLDGLEQLDIEVQVGLAPANEHALVEAPALEFTNALYLLDDDLIVSTFLEPHQAHEGDDLVKMEALIRDSLAIRREAIGHS
jgi:hypothetical protein